jgi:hypothetical protein
MNPKKKDKPEDSTYPFVPKLRKSTIDVTVYDGIQF